MLRSCLFPGFQVLPEDSKEFSKLKDFPDGVKSAVFKGNAEKWQVFTQVGYHGAKVILEPGRRYTSLDAMGLENPVKSMRRFIVTKVIFARALNYKSNT